MSIDFEMRLDLGMIRAELEAIVPIALERGAEAVRAKAVERTPDQSGHLRGEGGVTVTGAGTAAVADIKFGGPYAAYQNRGMRADGTHVIRNRPHGGQTGFLTETMADSVQLATDVVADTIRQHL